MRSVLVSHPHAAAVAVRVAEAFRRDGRLATFLTGVAAVDGSRGAWLLDAGRRIRRELENRVLPRSLGGHAQSMWGVEMLARGRAHFPWMSQAKPPLGLYDSLFDLHDRAVAALRWPAGVDAVYAYEDGALHTFERAASEGLQCVWDLASPYWTYTDRVWRAEASRWPDAAADGVPTSTERKRDRKAAELRLATAIVVASAFAKKSVEDHCDPDLVRVVPYGFPVDRFAARKSRPVGPFTVLAVGSLDLRKGTQYLLEAWRSAGLRDARLRLIGKPGLAKGFLDRYAGSFEHLPHVPRALLGEHYGAADVLAFPTLGDGFGLVMQEAMCSGTPVVTTGCGGGPECIVHGESGWLIESGFVDALVHFLRWAARNRDELAETGKKARLRAEAWTWADAGAALVAALTGTA